MNPMLSDVEFGFCCNGNGLMYDSRVLSDEVGDGAGGYGDGRGFGCGIRSGHGGVYGGFFRCGNGEGGSVDLSETKRFKRYE